MRKAEARKAGTLPWVQHEKAKNSAFATAILKPARQSNGIRKKAVRAELSSKTVEIRELKTEIKELKQKKTGKATVSLSVQRASQFNDMWRRLHYITKTFPQLKHYKDPARDERSDAHADLREWLRENMPSIEENLYESQPTFKLVRTRRSKTESK